MQGRTSRLLATVGIVTALAAVAACGSLPVTTGKVPGSQDGPHLSQADFVPVTLAASRAAGSVHTVRTETVKGRKTTTTGDIAFAHGYTGRVRTAVATGGSGVKSRADEVDLRVVGHTLYAHVPGLVPVGKFASRDLRLRANAKIGQFCACVFHLMEPTMLLQSMRRSIVKLDYVGLEAKWGEYVDHYRLVGDMAKIDNVEDGARMRTYDVWLDSDHRLRQMSYSTPLRTEKVTYSAWGKRVDVDAPGPKDMVRTLRG